MLVSITKVKDKAAMQQLVSDLSVDKIKQWNKDLVTQEVNLHLPKFKLKERYDMKICCQIWACPLLLKTRLPSNCLISLSTKIDEVYHQAVVIVDEKGHRKQQQ